MKTEEKLLTEIKLTKHNVQIIRLLCQVTSVIIVCLLIVSIVLAKLSIIQINEQISQPIHYISILAINMVIFYIFFVRKVEVTELTYKKINRLIGLYVTAITTISALHLFHNTEKYNQLMLYTLILLICCSFLVLSKLQMTMTLFISSLVVLWGIFFQEDRTDLNRQLVYLFSLLPIAYFISRSLFRSFHQSLTYQKELEKEVQMNRELTKKIQETNRKLELLSSIDPLTNLYNRRAFNHHLERLKQRKTPYKLSFIMLDIDCFKRYNDEYGHLEGDQVLIQIGNVLKMMSEEYSFFVARWGGEEFVVALLDDQVNSVNTVCKQICLNIQNLNIPHITSTAAPVVTVSVGAATKTIHTTDDIQQCLQKADDLLYMVKESGRNGYIHREISKVEL